MLHLRERALGEPHDLVPGSELVACGGHDHAADVRAKGHLRAASHRCHIRRRDSGTAHG